MPVKIRAPKKNETLVKKVTDRYSRVKEWIAHRRRLVLGALALSIVISGSLTGFLFFTRQAEEKAWVLEAEASHLFHDNGAAPEKDKGKETRIDRLTQAAQKYETLLEKHPSRKAAMIALYELGHVYFELEKYDLAEAKYLEFIKDNKFPALLPLVHLKLGYLYNKKDNTPEALTHFRVAYNVLKGSMIQEPTIKGSSTPEGEGGETEGHLNQDQAGFELARILEKMDKKPEAIEIYKKVSTTFTESPWGMEAKARLTRLEGGPTATSTSPDPSVPAQGLPTATAPDEPIPGSLPTAPKPVQPIVPKTTGSLDKDKSRPLTMPRKTDVAPLVSPKMEPPPLQSPAEGSESTPVTPTLETPVPPVKPDEKSSPPTTSPESAQPVPPATSKEETTPSSSESPPPGTAP